MLPLTNFIRRKIIVLNQKTTLFQAARAICENQVGCLLVQDENENAVGIVTVRDYICHALLNSKGQVTSLRETDLKKIMSRDLVAATSGSKLSDVIQLMEKYGFRRIPIVNNSREGKNRFVGLVTTDDLVVSNQIDPNTLFRIVQRQIDRSKSSAQKAVIRSAAHKFNTLHKFYAHFSGFMNVKPETISALVQFILSVLVLRMTFTGASHIIAQLPRLIQEPLLRLPPGPDRKFSGQKLIHELRSRFRFSEQQASVVLSSFLLGLHEWIGRDALEKLRAQLPQEYQPYFELASQQRKAVPFKNKKRLQSKIIHAAPDLIHSWSVPVSFTDRTQAALLLAQKLEEYRNRNPLILGIPRGAVPMAEILAEKLEGDMDVVLVHKIGAPENPEFGVGSVSEFGTVYHSKAAELCEIPNQYLEKSARQEIARLKQKRSVYTPIRPPLNPKDRVVIILDDGIATGSTMLAAIRAVRAQNPKQIIVASPVASLSAVALLQKEADQVIVLETPEEFVSVGQFYENFPQVADEEVYQVLSNVSIQVKSLPLKTLRNKSA